MVGHGRPREGPQGFASYPTRTHFFRSKRLLACCAYMVCAAHLLSAQSRSDELNVRIRATWGGTAPREWRATVIAPGAKLLQPRSLGTQADVPDDLVLERDTLRLTQPIPVTSDGLDLQVVGTDETVLSLEFTPVDKPESTKKLEVKLADFVSASKLFVLDELLDDQGNRLQLQRCPGDRLRVSFQRESLVFSPYDEFAFTVEPHELGLPAGTAMRCTVQLQPVDSEEVLWKDQHELRIDPNGNTAKIDSVKVPLPAEEGVYDVVISLTQRRFTDNLVPGNLVPAKPLMQRRVQVIVLGNQPLTSTPAEWELVDEIETANPKWWERLNWLPHWKVLPGMAPRAPLGDRPLEPTDFLGQTIYQIGPSGWHAAPIPIQEVGIPHILEVEFPNDRRQTLGISVVEPNAAGDVRNFSIDSGIDNPGHPKPAVAQLDKHRLIFWPRTKNPWLVLTNRRDNTNALFGRIRVLAGPSQLPPLQPAGAVDFAQGVNRPAGTVPLATGGGKRRMLAAYYDKPLFTENFGAADSLDIATGKSHKDWQTFYLGGLRLAEYLKHAGYQAAIIAVACDGSSLYPSRFLTSTPKFDDGVMFHSGQDPVQKDVLEMLLRIFDREGLKLIPAVQFGVPLTTLEEKLRIARNDLGGTWMIGFLPGDSKARFGHDSSRQGAAPFYNPLDPQVQTAMREVTSEVLNLCGSHPSFGGLAIQLSPYGYAVLPDDTWCLDDATFTRFTQAAQLPNPTGIERLVQRLNLVRGTARDQWLRWRADELTGFYKTLHDDVRQASAEGDLMLITTDLLTGRVVQNSLRPRLPNRSDFTDPMIRHGIDGASLARDAKALLLRPERLTTSVTFSTQATQLEPVQSIMDDYFQSAGQFGALNLNEAQTLQLPAFDKVSPFGPEKTAISLSAHVVSAGESYRARFVKEVAALDASFIANGGSMLPLGQEDRLGQFAKVFQQLPANLFVTVPSSAIGSRQIAVRYLNHSNQTFIYVANPQGMAATVQIELDLQSPCTARSLDDRKAPILPASPGSAIWTVALEAYDIAAISCSADDVKVKSWSTKFGESAVANLFGTMQELRVRVNQLDRFQPINALENPDFEQPSAPNQIAGWVFARNPGVTVELDGNQPYQGRQSLHLRIDGNKTLGWVSSRTFPYPRTGRIAVQAWIRTRDASRQPPLRISVSGTLANGQPYTRWSAIGVDVDPRTFQPSGRRVNPVSAEWSPILLHLPADLPVSPGGEIAVRFDMLGPGEVWIDNIQVSDVYFDPTELKELVKNTASANLKLEEGDVAYCEQFLQSYWARFLLEYVPAPRLTQATAPSTRRPATPPPAPTDEKVPKWKQMLQPKNPLKLQLK